VGKYFCQSKTSERKGEEKMTGQKLARIHGTQVTTHYDLQKITQDEIPSEGARIVADANQGIQTAIVGNDGRVRAVVGLNCVRYLPDADPDPLEEIVLSALESTKIEDEKK
jgi:hypothetical protein